jgi:hypothetical protein
MARRWEGAIESLPQTLQPPEFVRLCAAVEIRESSSKAVGISHDAHGMMDSLWFPRNRGVVEGMSYL